MPMNLKADITNAAKAAGTCKPVDLVHLSTMTMADPDLEREVLSIFLNQVAIHADAIRNAPGHDMRKRAAHSLKGASRGIGAWDLAEIAERAEQPVFTEQAELDAEIDRVRCYVQSLNN